jgi:hypothetical protein
MEDDVLAFYVPQLQSIYYLSLMIYASMPSKRTRRYNFNNFNAGPLMMRKLQNTPAFKHLLKNMNVFI